MTMTFMTAEVQTISHNVNTCHWTKSDGSTEAHNRADVDVIQWLN